MAAASSAVCRSTQLGLILLLVPLANAFLHEDGADVAAGASSLSSPSPQAPLLDMSRLSPVFLPEPVTLLSPDVIAEVAAAVATAAGLPAAQHLQLVKQENDELGFTHYRFDQVVPYDGGAARVYGGDVIAHVKDGQLLTISGNVASGISAALPPTVGRATARKNQLTHVRGRSPAFAANSLSDSELLVIPGTSTDMVAWCSKADLTSDVDAAGKARPALLRVCSAGHGNGQVVESRDELQKVAGTGNSFYSGQVTIDTKLVQTYSKKTKTYTNSYQMQAPAAGNGYTVNLNGGTSMSGSSVFADTDNTWGSGTLSDPATVAVDAHWGAMMTYSYFLNVHGRNGVRNDGFGPASYVHYSVGYNNAFWSDSCSCMTYGDGDGVTYNPFTALDVTGHEISHGVTSFTAGLLYQGESGGLNEATSDIFGTMVEWYANNTRDTPDYYIGENIYKNGGILRYMHQPSLNGNSPDCYFSSLGNLGVHSSSAIANHFYYLLAEGSSPANGLPASYTCDKSVVVGIGRAKAEKIWYRALTVYMTSSTNYAGARAATINASKDLYGDSSTETATVAKAWTAVSVN